MRRPDHVEVPDSTVDAPNVRELRTISSTGADDEIGIDNRVTLSLMTNTLSGVATFVNVWPVSADGRGPHRFRTRNDLTKRNERDRTQTKT